MASSIVTRRMTRAVGSLGLKPSFVRATSSATNHMESSLSVVYVTAPDGNVADVLGTKLVEAKLAACVNILPGITSIYKWEGKLNKDIEHLLIIKTRSDLLPSLTDFVKANHPYDTSEVIATPVTGGSEAYLSWALGQTKERT